jgi:haloalkane dehalogenase
MLTTLLLLFTLARADTGVLRTFTFSPSDTMAATLYGSGDRVVVIIPGMVGGGYAFRKVTPELVAAGRRVIVVDLLGAGKSSRPTKSDYSLTAQSKRVEHVLDSLGVRDATVLAHAVSGSVAYRLALHRPDQVKAVVGIDAGASETAATSGLKRAMNFSPLIKLLGAKRLLTGKIKGELTGRSADPSWVTQEVLDGYSAPYKEDAGRMVDILKQISRAQEPEQLVPNLPKIQAKVTLLVGATPADRVLSPEKIDVLRQGLQKFELETVEGAGVFIMEENPQAVIRAVLRN